MKPNQQSDKPLNYSGFRSNSLKQSGIDSLQTQHSSSFSQAQDYEQQQSMFGVEQDCLLKLMQQRKKIEELTYLYQKTSEKLEREEEKVKKLEVQQGSLEELKTIKLKYLSLGKEFQQVRSEKGLLQEENQKLKESLTTLSREHQKLLKLSHLKQLRKQQEITSQINRYQQLLRDKDDEIRRNLNVYELKEKQYNEQIHQLNQVINELKENAVDVTRNHDSDITQLTTEVVKRDALIEKIKVTVDNVKEQNSTLRKQLKDLDDQFISKEQQWIHAQDQLLFEVNNLQRKLNDTENHYNQSKYQCQKLQQKQKISIQSITNLKQALKSTQEQSSISLDQLTHSYELKIANCKYQIQELKQSVHELLEVKDIFNKENQMLKDRIRKDDQQKRRRNLIMRSELREIEKMENSVKRVL